MANEGVVPNFFILAETFAISSSCVATCQSITSGNITRYENVQEITMGYVKKIATALGNVIFDYQILGIWLQT